MLIISIDPSSTKTGIIGADYDSEQLLWCATINPPKTIKGEPVPYYLRMSWQLEKLAGYVNNYCPDRILVEIPDGKTRTHHPERKSGFGVWGFAAGAIWAYLRGFSPETASRLVAISNVWTRGSKKRLRKLATYQQFPEIYDPKKDGGLDNDRGGDMADAWIMAHKWIREEKTRVLVSKVSEDNHTEQKKIDLYGNKFRY